MVAGEVGTSGGACIQNGEVPFEGRRPPGHMNTGQGMVRQWVIGRLWEAVRPSQQAALVGKAFLASTGRVPSSVHPLCMR